MENVNMEKENIEKENKLGDVYIQKPNPFGGETKKQNVNHWEHIEGIVEEAVNEIAKSAGIEVIQWEDYSIIKGITRLITCNLEARFGVEYKFINENY